MSHPIDYTQARAGDGKQGPDVDAWTPWIHSSRTSREQVRQMAINQYVRAAGLSRGKTASPHTFTVWHYREGDPTHPNGRPKTVHAITLIFTPTKAPHHETA